MYKRLCLLGDFERQSSVDSSPTVSLYDTTGSVFFKGIPAWSSSRSFKQISKCSSPAPAIMCSPLSDETHKTIGSDLARRFIPSTSLGSCCWSLGSTATRTTGDTENFICFMLWACSKVVKVPVFTKNWSTPTRPHMLPQGTSSIGSVYLPIIKIVL